MVSPRTIDDGVPPATIDVTGEYYGGQYWNQAEYQVVLTHVSALTSTDPLVIATLADTSGTVIQTQLLTYRTAGDMVLALGDSALISGARQSLVDTPLMLKTTWPFGDAEHSVELHNELGEVHAWLRCALGLDTYDGGEEWEF